MTQTATARQIRQSWRHTGSRENLRSAANTGFYGFSRPVYHTSLRIKDGRGIDPACGSGGMFIQSGDFVNQSGMNANSAMTFYGQEKVEYNAQLCLMNMAVHGLTGVIKS